MGQSWTKAHDSSKNTFWENYPSIASPIIDTELNRNEVSVDTVDDRVITLDTTKAEQSDLLQAFKDVSLDSTTGVITFTLFNNTTKTIDTLLEKIAINFDYDDNPSSPHYQNLVIELEDGTYKYIDMSALITQYEFTNSSCISWTIGNDGSVTANIIDGSITGAKLQPNYLADCLSAKSGAENAEADAIAKALVAEGYANGKQNGVPVTSESPYYHNNAEYFKDQASSIVGSKVDSFNGRTGVVTSQAGDYTQDMISVPSGASAGQVPTAVSDGQGGLEFQMQTPSEGLKPHFVITSDTGSTVTVAKGGTTYTTTETSTGIFECNVADYGTYTVTSVLNGDTFTATVSVDSVKVYNVDARHFHADITVTFPNGGTDTVTLTLGGTVLTATSSPYTFTVHDSGNWVLNREVNGSDVYTKTITVSTSGQTFSEDIPELLTLKGIQNVLDYHRESALLNVGDEVDTKINGSDVTFQILDINHYSSHDVCFCAKVVYGESAFHSVQTYVNYSTSDRLKPYVDNILSQMTEASYLKDTTKHSVSSGASGQGSDYTAKLWLPTMKEVDGVGQTGSSADDTQFALFTTQANRIKTYGGVADYWWTSDGVYNHYEVAWGVTQNGTIENGLWDSVTNSNGVVPCFRLTADS